MREVEDFSPKADEEETDEPGSNDELAVFVLALWGKIEPLKNPTPKQTNATITTLVVHDSFVGRPLQYIELCDVCPAQSLNL